MNKKHIIRYFSAFLAILMLLSLLPTSASDPEVPENETADFPTIAEPSFEGDAKSLILIEATTGKVLFENNADEARARVKALCEKYPLY